MTRMVTQTFPYPQILADLVARWQYRPGWKTWLADNFVRDRDPDGEPLSQGLTLIVVTQGYDSRHPDRGENYRVQHFFPVPPATYDMRSWRRWLLECHLTVDRHEGCEFAALQTDDGLEFPWAPSHGPGNDPYMIREVGTIEDQRTRFTGEVYDQ